MNDDNQFSNKTKLSDSRKNTNSRSLTFNKAIDEEDLKYDPNLYLYKYSDTYAHHTYTNSSDRLNNKKDYNQTNDLGKLNYTNKNLEDKKYSNRLVLIVPQLIKELFNF